MKRILLVILMVGLLASIVSADSTNPYSPDLATIQGMSFAWNAGGTTSSNLTVTPGVGVVTFAANLQSGDGQGSGWASVGIGYPWPTSPSDTDLSSYDGYALTLKNTDNTNWLVNVYMNTGWTDAPWSETNHFYENSWTELAPGESATLMLDFAALGVVNTNHVTNIGFQVGGNMTNPWVLPNPSNPDNFHITVSQAVPTEFSYSPSPANMYDLDHHMWYKWKIDLTSAPGYTIGTPITEATLTFHNINNWDDNTNVLHIHLLNSTSPGTLSSGTDNQNAGDYFAGKGVWIDSWHDNDGDPGPAEELVYTFSSLPDGRNILFGTDSLNSYASDGYVAFGIDPDCLGIDPDCHYWNSGVEFKIYTSAIPEPATLFLLAPNGGEVLTGGSLSPITWSSAGSISDVLIEYSINNGSTWTPIDTVSNTGSYNWLVPAVNSNQCLVRISDASNSSISDTSDAIFTINNSTRLVPGEYPTIQAAIDASVNGDTVIVAPGTYTGTGNRDIDFNGKAITVRSADPNDPNVVAATVIDCQSAGRGFYFHSGEDANSVLKGLTITNGYGVYGGAILCDNSSPFLTDCVFNGNSAEIIGCISMIGGGNLTVINCTFSGNSTSCIYMVGGGNLSVTNCVFSGNMGDAMCFGRNIKAVVINCVFDSAGGGSAMYIWEYSQVVLTNCTFSRNGIYIEGNCSLMVTNCIFWNLSSLIIDSTSLTVINSIFGNSSRIINIGGPRPNVKYSDIQGGWSGEGNIDTDPCFVNPGNNDFHLLPDSPCIDAGDQNYVVGPNETDLDGNPRVIGGRIDMGAYEFNGGQLSDLIVTSEGINFVPIPGNVGQPATISATIRNTGDIASRNVWVRFGDNSEVIRDVLIDEILPWGNRIVTIERSWDAAAFHVISVTVDPNNTIEESDENNNFGSKVYQVGNISDMDADIEVSYSGPAFFYESTTGTINGKAEYRFRISGYPDVKYPVKGAAMTAEIFYPTGTTVPVQTKTAFTGPDGEFSFSFDVPGNEGELFDVNISVWDNSTLEPGRLKMTFPVQDIPIVNDLYVYQSDITFSNNNPDAGEQTSIQTVIHADARNTQTFIDVPVTFYVYSPTGVKTELSQPPPIDEMLPGANRSTETVNLTPEIDGDYYIEVVIGVSDDRNWNNIAGRTIHVGPIEYPLFTITANPMYNVHLGQSVEITVDSREQLLNDTLNSITVVDSTGHSIDTTLKSHIQGSKKWIFLTETLENDIVPGQVTITVTGATATDPGTLLQCNGYFYVEGIQIKSDLGLNSSDISFSDENPDSGETININAAIHAGNNTYPSRNVPVTITAYHASGGSYTIGQAYISEILPGESGLVSAPWTNVALGGYSIEVKLGPGYSDDYYYNNQATQAIVVGNEPFLTGGFTVIEKIRVGASRFKYICKMTLNNVSRVAVEDVQLELIEIAGNITVIDPYVSFAHIGIGESVVGEDTCIFEVERSAPIELNQLRWRATYKRVDTNEAVEQKFVPMVVLSIVNGDLNVDGLIDIADLAILAKDWLHGNSVADIAPLPHSDGIVNFLDFAVLADNWLQ